MLIAGLAGWQDYGMTVVGDYGMQGDGCRRRRKGQAKAEVSRVSGIMQGEEGRYPAGPVGSVMWSPLLVRCAPETSGWNTSRTAARLRNTTCRDTACIAETVTVEVSAERGGADPGTAPPAALLPPLLRCAVPLAEVK